MYRQPFNRKHRQRRDGFTLVEVMIVIVAMAIIAGAIIPKFGSYVDEAKESAMLADLHMLTKAIEHYKIHHYGYPPDSLSGASLPQLTSQTNASGDVGTGPGFSFGAYLFGNLPANPMNDDANVYEATTIPPPNLDEKTGWWYHKASGQVWGGESRNRGLLGL